MTCAEILRAVRRSRIRSVALMHALECEPSIDDWYGAIKTLRDNGELNGQETVFLIDGFLDNPGLGPFQLDAELKEVAKAQAEAGFGSREEFLAEKWRQARESFLRCVLFRRWSDAELLHLAEQHAHEWDAESLAGQEQYLEGRPLTEDDYAADLLVEQPWKVPRPPGAGTPEMEWCIREIRTLAALGIRSESNLELRYVSVASGRAWFGAISALQEAGEINGACAAYLFERFGAVASDSPLLELRRSDVEAVDEESFEGTDARRDSLIRYYRTVGKGALADMFATDRENFERLWRRGRHELLRATRRGGGHSIGPGFRDRLR